MYSKNRKGELFKLRILQFVRIKKDTLILGENRQHRIDVVREKVRRRSRSSLKSRRRHAVARWAEVHRAAQVVFLLAWQAMQANDTRVHVKHIRAHVLVIAREKKCMFTHTGVSDDFTCVPRTLTAHRC